MDFRYLGTAAAEGWPAVFCNCDHCLRAKSAGGRNLRTRSQAIINDDLLIDFPGDTYAHVLKNHLDLSAVRWLIVTHAHLDHFAPVDLFFRSEAYYAHNMTSKELVLAGNEKVLENLRKYAAVYSDEPSELGIKPEYLPLYQPTSYGPYTVTALRANHSNGEEARTYLITDGEKTILYLHDTGVMADEVFDYLASVHAKADLISYDCTFVTLPSGGGHLGLDSCLPTRDKLSAIGVTKPETIHCINHFSHNGKLIYDELVPVAAKQGFETSYDGMLIHL